MHFLIYGVAHGLLYFMTCFAELGCFWASENNCQKDASAGATEDGYEPTDFVEWEITA